MNFILSLVLNFILAAIGNWLGYWWVIFPSSFLICGSINKKAWPAFLSGYISIFLLWISLSWFYSRDGGRLLWQRMANLFYLHYPILLFLVSAFYGGLCAGMAAWCGRIVLDFLGIRQEHLYRW